ncbi:MAG: DUF692 domain-containing protein [Deltaproteobacteria bacterium]|nr:DUF692 domain-containing protein [Deltaproteobacteria bacterium]MBW2363152.1 DUF692 domain-containing protein [Deltaproteobacteria bacterium]
MGIIRGAGLGLREPHIEEILDHLPPVPWFEVLADNYLGIGGRPRDRLFEIRAHYPVVFHSVGMNLGSVDPLDEDYLDRLLELRAELQPEWISDHFCWTAARGRHHHDLLPLPCTEEVIAHLCERVSRVQDRLGERMLLENASAYVAFRDSECSEWEFVREVAERADCFLLLDINNIYVNSYNFGFDPREYLEAIPRERVKQIHLAGFSDERTHLIDTHGADVSADVWRLYRDSVELLGAVPACVERDSNIPAFDVIFDEARRAQQVMLEETGGAS